MDVREKLVELQLKADIEDEVSENTTQHREYIADLMIAHGVTVQEWISVKDRLPEKDDKVLAVVKEDGYNRIAFVFYEDRRGWECLYDGFHNINVTHWMPLPQPPKGE